MNTDHPASQILCRDDCVIVLIDLQEKLLPVIHGHETVIENAARLARFAQITHIPVIATEQEKLGTTVSAITTALPTVQPISKLTFSCFSCQAFADALSALNRSTVILAGVEAHICVLQTAIQALPDHTVHIIADAASSRVPENKHISLQRAREAGAVITTTEIFMYEILQRAGTDEFRAVLPLVK